MEAPQTSQHRAISSATFVISPHRPRTGAARPKIQKGRIRPSWWDLHMSDQNAATPARRACKATRERQRDPPCAAGQRYCPNFWHNRQTAGTARQKSWQFKGDHRTTAACGGYVCAHENTAHSMQVPEREKTGARRHNGAWAQRVARSGHSGVERRNTFNQPGLYEPASFSAILHAFSHCRVAGLDDGHFAADEANSNAVAVQHRHCCFLGMVRVGSLAQEALCGNSVCFRIFCGNAIACGTGAVCLA